MQASSALALQRTGALLPLLRAVDDEGEGDGVVMPPIALGGTSHLVLCPGCGYSFWTTDLSEIVGCRGHCYRPDSRDPMLSDLDDGTYHWLVDQDAIDFIAMPELFTPTSSFRGRA